MVASKRFKDPIYGYIDISNDLIGDVVDTANFQRLRNVVQTSYAPLYSSAVHNRFVHSLGVFHLGGIVAKTIKEDEEKLEGIENIDRFLELFELACLLHDLGHAPFSHTGEEYYLKDGTREELHNNIIELTEDADLQKEIEKRNFKAAPHELMSVIVALRKYAALFNCAEEKSFFARCITGYKYFVKTDKLHSFLNCLISLLNSSVIDVDKLDYLIRDAYITGFETVAVDYERLLRSIRIRDIKDTYEIVFVKGAISVIENVIYAHDAERKWIQNHPVVLYDAYLVQRAIEEINERYSETNIFSYEALTTQGVPVSDNYKVSLLCDADVIFLMKNLADDCMNEYFDRKERRHPLWKSESEYKAIFSEGYSDKIFDIIEQSLEDLGKFLNFINKSQGINEKAIEACEQEIKRHQELLEADPDKEKQYNAAISMKKKNLKWMTLLKEFAENQNIPFDFVFIKSNQFNSGFAKEDFAKIKIEFNDVGKSHYFEKVTNVLKAEKSERDKFFYLYYRRDGEKRNIDVKKLASILGKAAMEEVYE